MEDTLNLYEAAQYVGVPEEQLRWWADMGVGPNFTGNVYRPASMSYRRHELDAWIAQARQGMRLH